jgi:hypothetical protein
MKPVRPGNLRQGRCIDIGGKFLEAAEDGRGWALGDDVGAPEGGPSARRIMGPDLTWVDRPNRRSRVAVSSIEKVN